MNDVEINLKAKNSSGVQTLHLTSDNGEYWFTLCGTYEGKYIQIDFDNLSKKKLKRIRKSIKLIIDRL